MVMERGHGHFAHWCAAQGLGDQRGADFFVAHFHYQFITSVVLLQFRPVVQQGAGISVQSLLALGGQTQRGLRSAGSAFHIHRQHGGGSLELLHFTRQLRLFGGALFVAAHGVADLGQVAAARRRHDGRLVRAVTHIHCWQAACLQFQTTRLQTRLHGLEQGGHAVVVEMRGHGAKHRHLFGGCAPGFLVALHLLGHIAQRIGCAFAVEFVDRHKLCKVEHVDFFQLAGCAKFGRHHVQRDVHMRHDGRIPLANARGFDDDQVKASALGGGNDVGQSGADFAAKFTRGQTAHEDATALLPW